MNYYLNKRIAILKVYIYTSQRCKSKSGAEEIFFWKRVILVFRNRQYTDQKCRFPPSKFSSIKLLTPPPPLIIHQYNIMRLCQRGSHKSHNFPLYKCVSHIKPRLPIYIYINIYIYMVIHRTRMCHGISRSFFMDNEMFGNLLLLSTISGGICHYVILFCTGQNRCTHIIFNAPYKA